MVDSNEKDKDPRSYARFLMIALATSSWGFLSIARIVPYAEAILIGWVVGFVVGYWIPPKPEVGFYRWTGERLVMIGLFYVVGLKMPDLLLRSLNQYVAHGIGFIVFLVAYFAWTRHPTSTLRPHRFRD